MRFTVQLAVDRLKCRLKVRRSVRNTISESISIVMALHLSHMISKFATALACLTQNIELGSDRTKYHVTTINVDCHYQSEKETKTQHGKI